MAEATNSALMRQKNEKIILSLINKEPVSRVEIAKKTGLTKAAVTIITDDLKKRGIITEEKSSTASVGRNPVLLHLNGDSVYMIGININRMNITVGIIDLCGKVLIEDTFPTSAPDVTFSEIEKTIRSQIKKTGVDCSKIYKIAVVTPGPVDVKNGKILNPPNFEDWHGIPVEQEIKKFLDYDVIFDNISAAVAVAERYFGAAQNAENFIALLVDEGVGSGIIINGELFKGLCELGHVSIKHDGEQCECGNRGCLEKYASISNLLKNTPFKSWHECVEHDEDEIIRREAEYLSTAIITANNIFNLEKAVLCGELTYKSEKLISMISEKIIDKMLLKKEFCVRSGSVKSPTLIAASIGIHHFFYN